VTATVYGTDANGEFVYGVYEVADGAATASGRDNGRPGIRRYHAGYYAAFLLDLDGCNIEAVCHQG